jgi:HSP20 family molecular chaperone IbpA
MDYLSGFPVLVFGKIGANEMRRQPAIVMQERQNDLGSLFLPSQIYDEHVRIVFDIISRRAYEMFERRGRVHGHDWEDWYKAESALLQVVTNEVSDSGDAFNTIVNIADYNPLDLKISAEPRCLRICGCADDENHKTEISGRTLAYPRAFLLSYKFPVPIDPTDTSAEIRSDLLEVRLPKTTGSAEVSN